MKILKFASILLGTFLISLSSLQAQPGKNKNTTVVVGETQKKAVVVRPAVVGTNKKYTKNPNYKNGYYRNHKVYTSTTGRKYYLNSKRQRVYINLR